MENRNSIIALLGMHRSGTSLIANAVAVLGASLGNNLLPSKEDNPSGFWENEAIVGLNDRLLAATHSSWYHIASPKSTLIEHETLADLRNEARAILSSEFPGGTMWAFKDPRAIRLWWFWREVLSDLHREERNILIVRHPLSVAQSLSTRNKFTIKHGLLLWLSHYLADWQSYGNTLYAAIDYDRFLRAPDNQLARIANIIGISISDNMLRDITDGIVRPQLRHHFLDEVEITSDDPLIALVMRCYHAIIAYAEGGRADAFSDAMVALSHEFHQMDSILEELDEIRESATTETRNKLLGRYVSRCYLRTPEHPHYSEGLAVDTEIKADPQRYTLHFALPTSNFIQLRWDPADVPGCLLLYRIILQNGRGQILWNWNAHGQEFPFSALGNASALFVKSDGDALALLMNGPDAWMELAFVTEPLASIAATLTIDLSWPQEIDFLVAKSTYLHILRQHEAAINEIEAIYQSRSWKLTAPLRRAVASFTLIMSRLKLFVATGHRGREYRFQIARRIFHQFPSLQKHRLRILGKALRDRNQRLNFQEWYIKHLVLQDNELRAIAGDIGRLAYLPVFSIIMPVYNANLDFLEKAISSIKYQVYPHWELCIADDHSSHPAVLTFLRNVAQGDQRIKVVFRQENGHIAATSNTALEVATGDYVVFLDQDDMLPAQALYYLAKNLQGKNKALLLYSDEDKIDEHDRHSDPYWKPDWNPELLLCKNYINHLAAYERQRLLEIGGLRSDLSGSQDWDLLLRYTDHLDNSRIKHIPAILYHWRMHADSTAGDAQAKPYALTAGQRAVRDALERRGESFHEVQTVCSGTFNYPVFAAQGTPLVDIFIPTRNSCDLLEVCIDSLHKTHYRNWRLFIIDNQSNDAETLAYLNMLAQTGQATVLRYDRPFDYAEMHNWAVPQGTGEFLCLLNNDIEIRAETWLEEMLAHAQRPGIGAVGAKLLYPDGSIQHGGVVLGLGGIAGHAHKGFSEDACGYFGRAQLLQNFSAVTAACLVTSRKNWDLVHGFTPELQVAFNDVDFCLKLGEQGLRHVYVPRATLYHHESKSRGSDIEGKKLRRFALEHAYMQWRWGPKLLHDPAYNPALTLVSEDFQQAASPRIPKPWQEQPEVLDIPYGLSLLPTHRLLLHNEQALSGSFPVPVGAQGLLREVRIFVGTSYGRADGVLRLKISNAQGESATADAELLGCRDNNFLVLPFSSPQIRVHGDERLFFRLGLRGARHPLILWTYSLGTRWGHGLPDAESALRLQITLSQTTVESTLR
jgi:glycosyltransferase involved in cell wall biosynthesis